MPTPVIPPNKTYTNRLQFQDIFANATGAVKAAPGHVYSLSCYNDNAAARYILLFNNTAAPVDNDVPLFGFLVPGKSQIIVGTDFFGDVGGNFTTGIAYGFSERPNYLDTAPAEHILFIQYL